MGFVDITFCRIVDYQHIVRDITLASETTSENTRAGEWFLIYEKAEKQVAAEWMGSVADGSNSMSGRRLSSIEKRGGGIKAVTAAAKKRKVHLVLFEDDQGNEVVAASVKPFKVIA